MLEETEFELCDDTRVRALADLIKAAEAGERVTWLARDGARVAVIAPAGVVRINSGRPGRRRKGSVTDAQIIEAYRAQRLSTGQVAVKLDISRTTVERCLKKHKVPMRGAAGRPRTPG
jgi:transcriptional regulator of acetoin/glycerol metabolism